MTVLFLLKNIFSYFLVKVLRGLTLKKEKQHLNLHTVMENMECIESLYMEEYLENIHHLYLDIT